MNAPAESIHEILRSRAAEKGGALSFRDFSEIALFDPRFGYYRQARKRVGRSAGTDFYTAASLGEIFGKLIRHAAGTLLGGEENLKNFRLVEIGAEPGQTHFAAQKKFFAETQTIRVGEDFEIPERAVVIANELFDAQPFFRLVARGGKWRELGVAEDPRERGIWREIVLPEISAPELRAFAETTPVPDDGWHLDISTDAEKLLRKILAGDWRGAAIFLDYGKTLADCLDAFPQGTARAYFRHGQTNALYDAPGEQDLTCHVFWDRLLDVFRSCGFRSEKVLWQETFFMKNALRGIEEIFSAGTSPENTRERAALAELIHPAKMGHAFQVLAGTRL